MWFFLWKSSRLWIHRKDKPHYFKLPVVFRLRDQWRESDAVGIPCDLNPRTRARRTRWSCFHRPNGSNKPLKEQWFQSNLFKTIYIRHWVVDINQRIINLKKLKLFLSCCYLKEYSSNMCLTYNTHTNMNISNCCVLYYLFPFEASRTKSWSVSGTIFCTNTCWSSFSPYGPNKRHKSNHIFIVYGDWRV